VGKSAFIGVDLAWKGARNKSGVALLIGDRDGARMLDASTVRGNEEIFAYIDRHSLETTFIAVDAPLIIRNASGQRGCETLVGRCYGARDASCHTSNLSLYPGADSVELASQLLSNGFKHATSSGLGDDRVLLEVYPHAAMIELFRLSKIIKYKKGRVAEKASGQKTLQQKIAELSAFLPPLQDTPGFSATLSVDTSSLRGKDLKWNEDKLDALVCAYIAYYYWYWRDSWNHVFGDEESGYIIVPCGGSQTRRELLTDDQSQSLVRR
jgi:predicted RNase H-like nuclease